MKRRLTPRFRAAAAACGAVACLLVLCLARVSAQELPAHIGKVNDFAELLEPGQRETLEEQLGALERATSAEVTLVTMATIDGESVEDYALRLFNAWGVGKKDRDNGMMVLVAVQERAMRIEVGYGLEGVIPDGLAGAVIRDTFLPRFRDGDYKTGVLDGMARLIDIVRRNEVLTPEQRTALDRAAAESGKSWGMAGFLSLFVSAGAFALGTAAGAQVIVQLLFGLVFTGGALFFSTFIAPRAAVWLLGGLAIGVALLGARLARTPKWRRMIRGTGASAGGTGWISEGSGGSTSSGSGGGSSSSGGFGGGSSGGGGASGHW